jgi:hypothetical protein
MVILIAGAGYVGKTLMAQKILEIDKMPYLSIDHLKMGIYRSDNKCGFTPESEDEIITEKLWPVIKGIAKQFHATPEMWRRENRTKGTARLRFFGARAALAAKRIQSCYVPFGFIIFPLISHYPAVSKYFLLPYSIISSVIYKI